MNYLASPYIQIPFSERHYSLMFFSMRSWAETSARAQAIEDAIDREGNQYLKESKVRVRRLADDEMEELIAELDNCNLSEVEMMLCKRAQCIVNIAGIRNGRSHYAPFWACHQLATRLAREIDGVIVDLAQGTACNGDDISEKQRQDIPLTGAFLTVKAYPKTSVENSYFLRTEGMIRFGLPELTLPEVPVNLGSDCAYLLRGIAQFLWTQLQDTHPEQPFVTVESSFKLAARFCQFGNPTFHSVEELHLPVALELLETRQEDMLVVRPTPDFADYYEWLCSLIERITEHRLYIQRLEAIEAGEMLVQPIAA